MAIEGFKYKGLEELFQNGKSRRIGNRFHKKAIELMDILDAAIDTRDLNGVSDFHPLKGNRRGEFSMHVNGNWCLTFTFASGEVHDLNFEDYHG